MMGKGHSQLNLDFAFRKRRNIQFQFRLGRKEKEKQTPEGAQMMGRVSKQEIGKETRILFYLFFINKK